MRIRRMRQRRKYSKKEEDEEDQEEYRLRTPTDYDISLKFLLITTNLALLL